MADVSFFSLYFTTWTVPVWVETRDGDEDALMYPQGKRLSAAAWVGVLKIPQGYTGHAYIPAFYLGIYKSSICN
jgi:hypothetical protein